MTQKVQLDMVGEATNAWAGGYKALQSDSGALAMSPTAVLQAQNLYYNGTDWKYISTGYGSALVQNGGEFFVYIAPSGTAGATATLTPAYKVDATGRAFGQAYGNGQGLMPASQYYRLNSGLTGANSTANQSWLGVGVTLAANTTYEFEGVLQMSKSSGITSHQINLLFGGTAVMNHIAYEVMGGGNGASAIPVLGSNNMLAGHIATAGPVAISPSLTSAAYYLSVYMRGSVSVASAGTFQPQYSLSAAPGGAYTVAQGSFFRIAPISAAGANTSIGNWA